MVAVVIYTLAALGVLTVVGCAAILYGCVRIARHADSEQIPGVSGAVRDDSHDPAYAEYGVFETRR